MLSTKKRDYIKDEVSEVEINTETKICRYLYRDINRA
jgi:hypothetical protein